jgi:hypothetical protein
MLFKVMVTFEVPEVGASNDQISTRAPAFNAEPRKVKGAAP